MEHKIIIPGLDRQLCGVCKKWICRPNELERLKRQLATAGTKRLGALHLEYAQDEALAQSCPGPTIKKQ